MANMYPRIKAAYTLSKVEEGGLVPPRLYSAPAQDGPQEMEKFKQQPSMLPGSAVPGSCLVSFYFLWAILSTSTVLLAVFCSMKEKYS